MGRSPIGSTWVRGSGNVAPLPFMFSFAAILMVSVDEFVKDHEAMVDMVKIKREAREGGRIQTAEAA